jgi:hypothetical protein
MFILHKKQRDVTIADSEALTELGATCVMAVKGMLRRSQEIAVAERLIELAKANPTVRVSVTVNGSSFDVGSNAGANLTDVVHVTYQPE